MITLVIVTVLYVVAAIALVGMQPYYEISPESGFPNAFAYNGIEWAAQLTAVSILSKKKTFDVSFIHPFLFVSFCFDCVCVCVCGSVGG